jgi:hypothetical protein
MFPLLAVVNRTINTEESVAESVESELIRTSHKRVKTDETQEITKSTTKSVKGKETF